MKIESKIGTIQKPQIDIFNFLSDFRNLEKFIPADKARNWQATEDTCKFSVDMAGTIFMQIISKEPHKTLKFGGNVQGKPMDFLFWVQLKEIETNDTKVKLTLKAELPTMMQAMAKKPLKEVLDTLVDRLDGIFQQVLGQ